MEDKFEAFEEDFEAKPASYQLWLLGYDKDQNITDYEFLVTDNDEPEPVIKQANQYIDEEKYHNKKFPPNVAYLEVIVETVVNVEGIDTNVGTLFSQIVKI